MRDSEVYPVNKPLITEEDIKCVSKTLREGWISGDGPVIQDFEEKFAGSLSRSFGVAVSNGSVALDLVFEVLNLPEGSEVILPTFTIISCLSPILRRKLVPVFVDANLSTWNVDIEDVIALVTPATKAILLVHTYGLGIPIGDLENFCQNKGIYLIEDAAEAHGVEVKGRKAGSFGHISTFSFYANKLITTGEGGMILTDDKNISDRLRLLRNLAFNKNMRFVHDELGYNYRLSSMQAALGTSQLARIDETLSHRIHIAETYKSHLKYNELFSFQVSQTAFSTNVYWVVGLLLKQSLRQYKERIVEQLAISGVETRPFFFPLHKQPLLPQYEIKSDIKLPNAEYLYDAGFYLPSGNGYAIEEIVDISRIFNEVLRHIIYKEHVTY